MNITNFEQIDIFEILNRVTAPIIEVAKKTMIDLSTLNESKNKKTIEEYNREIKSMIEEYDHHKRILEVGSFDPFHCDGMSLFLVRNHILYAKRILSNLNEKYGLVLPKEYYWDLPEEYPMDYLVQGSKAGHLTHDGKKYSKDELISWRESKGLLN